MKKIIVINGSGEVGKDTFVMYFKENAYYRKINDGYNIGDVYNISSVDKVKEIARYMGWDGKKDNKSRKFISDLKDSWSNYNNGPFNDMIETINSYMKFNITTSKFMPLHKMYDGIFFLHVREPCEIVKLKNYYGDECITLLIKRHENTFNNHADQNVENYKYDFIIENYGTLEDFRKTVDNFIKTVII